MNGTFDPTYSSNQIWMDTNLNECLTTHLEGIEGDVSSLQSNKADVNHTHSYNNLTGKPTIPTTLPANGGNADTVDGKHANSFATASSVSTLQTLVNGTADIVVDKGTSGNLTYRKWKSGVSEAWYYEVLGEIPLTTSMISGVWSNSLYNGRIVNFPNGLFIDIPTAVGNIYGSAYLNFQVASAIKSKMVYRIWCPYSTTVSGGYVSIHVIGKWK
jgi:hypothetical protein